MALNLADTHLESRLNVDAEVEQKLVDSLVNMNFTNPRPAYYKHNLVSRISHYFKVRKIDFGDEYHTSEKYLNSNINKEPLKSVERGMRIRDMPAEFIDRLDDFEKIYFFAGIDALKNNVPDVAAMTPYEIASTYIRAGIDQMQRMHNSILEGNENRRKVRRGHRAETYKNTWSAPHSKEIRRRLLTQAQINDNIKSRYGPMLEEFGRLFTQERLYLTKDDNLWTVTHEATNILDDPSERIAIKLDSLNARELAVVKRMYGADAVGGYANADNFK